MFETVAAGTLFDSKRPVVCGEQDGKETIKNRVLAISAWGDILLEP